MTYAYLTLILAALYALICEVAAWIRAERLRKLAMRQLRDDKAAGRCGCEEFLP